MAMREILFRGKCFDNDEWVYGAYCPKNCDDFFGPMIDKPSIIKLNEPCSGFWFDVDPSTVGQFTGRTDKKGKKIFEGDIVKFTRINALGYTTRRTGDVRYYDKLPVFYIKATTGDAWDWCDCEAIEIIGNIHDNPELLEDGE